MDGSAAARAPALAAFCPLSSPPPLPSPPALAVGLGTLCSAASAAVAEAAADTSTARSSPSQETARCGMPGACCWHATATPPIDAPATAALSAAISKTSPPPSDATFLTPGTVFILQRAPRSRPCQARASTATGCTPRVRGRLTVARGAAPRRRRHQCLKGLTGAKVERRSTFNFLSRSRDLK